MDNKPCDKEIEKIETLEKLLQGQKEKEVKLLQRISELEQTENFYDALMQNTEDYVLICDRNGVSQAFNASYKQKGEELLKTEIKPGIKPHKLSGKHEIIKYWDSLQDRVLKGEKFVEEFYDEEGDQYFETLFCPVRGGQEITGFTEITRNITARKRMEMELRASHSFNSSLLEHSPNAMLVYNPDTSIRYVNTFFLQLTGYSIEDVIGKKTLIPGRLMMRNTGILRKEKEKA